MVHYYNASSDQYMVIAQQCVKGKKKAGGHLLSKRTKQSGIYWKRFFIMFHKLRLVSIATAESMRTPTEIFT